MKKGLFFVSSLYLILNGGLWTPCYHFEGCCISKIAFFAWEATWGRGHTLDDVKRRGVSSANRWYLCLEEEESMEHLFLNCPKIEGLYFLIFSMYGLGFSLEDDFVLFPAVCLNKRNKVALMTLLSSPKAEASFCFNVVGACKAIRIEGLNSFVNFLDWIGVFERWANVSSLFRGILCNLFNESFSYLKKKYQNCIFNPEADRTNL